MAKKITRSRQFKNCGGCDQPFLTYKNYDYCSNCTLNNSRYVPKIFLKENGHFKRCPECGDGSGWIKFPKQKSRPCKLCALSFNKKTMDQSPFIKNINQTKEEKFWDRVDQLAQEKIYHLLTSNIPFQNVKLITEAYQFTDQQQKLSGLFLTRDTDYRTLLSDIESQYSDTNLPEVEQLAEEIAVNYFYLVFKALLTDLGNCYGFDPSYFSLENLFKE